MTAAYTAASENTLVYESQSSATISVIGPIADHILLAVTGAAPTSGHARFDGILLHEHTSEEHTADADTADESSEEDDEAMNERRLELESISEELATVLRNELRGLKWPDDI